MRNRSLLLVLSILCLVCASLAAQESPNTIIPANKRRFGIPFDPLPGQTFSNLKRLNLYASTDLGKSWTLMATATPEQGKFNVSVERDGLYWFTVQTVDQRDLKTPPDLDNAQPKIKVLVDTTPPRVTVQALTPRGGEVGVKWEIEEENRDRALADAVRLEYRQAGSTTWIPLTITPNAQQYYWNPMTVAMVEVRVRVRDLAGNWGEGYATTSLGGGQPVPPSPPQVQPFNPLPAQPSDAEKKYVNSQKITLSYDIKNEGPSGVSQVELWYTLDGRVWQQYTEMKFGGDPNQRSVTFSVARDGLYGITLLARSGVGLAERPPQTGDRPQLWIEVITTKPVIQLNTPVVGLPNGPEKGKVTFTWNASGKALQHEPISLSYAENPTGPWTPIRGAEKLPNNSRYVWVLPEHPPYQIYVKAEVIDKAGNVGESITPEMVRIDQHKPIAIPLDVKKAP